MNNEQLDTTAGGDPNGLEVESYLDLEALERQFAHIALESEVDAGE